MEKARNFNDMDNNEDNLKNLKNVFLFILMIIISYLIEISKPNGIFRKIYIIIIIIIVIGFIGKNLSGKNYYNFIFNLINWIKKKIPFLSSLNKSSNDIKNKIKKEKLEKIKNIYAYGYSSNKKNNINYNTNEPNSRYNISDFSKFNHQTTNYNTYQNDNDEYLASKISNINKINAGSPNIMDSFYTNNNYNGNNYYKINSNINTNLNEFTNYGFKQDSKNSKFNIKNGKNNFMNVENPFKAQLRNKNYSDSSSSENYFLFNTNKNKNKISFNNNINPSPINKFMEYENYQNINNIIGNSQMKKIPKNKEVSYMKYQNLKNRNDNTQSLNPNKSILKYDALKIPSELIDINYNNWIIRMSNFISKILIPELITIHDNNISGLNSILASLGLKIISTMPENDSDDFLDTLKDKLSYVNSNKLSDVKDNNNILFENLKKHYDNKIFNNNFNNFDNDNDNIFNNNNKKNIFPSLNTFNSFLDESKSLNVNRNNEKKLKNIFFGDTNKIKEILIIVEKKINSLQSQRNNNFRNNPYYQRQLIINKINSDNNPFLKKEIAKSYDSYFKDPNENNLTLTRLQKLLYERIIINERLYPKELFYKKNETHALLVMEYAIERLRQLHQNFYSYGSGSMGGEFLNENWCSLLPTDSQLIAHIVVNYLESIYLINNNKNQQIFLLSYPSNYNISIDEKDSRNKNKTSIFLYQINPPDTEPIFNVVYQGNLIPCIVDNYNLFQALCIYFYLLNIKSQMFVMYLGIHDFINNLIK